MAEVKHWIKTYDIAILCETWLKPRHGSGMFSIPGYALFRQDRVGHVGGGIGVYARSCYLRSVYNFTYHRADVPFSELFWIRTKVSDSFTVVIGTCYHPPKPRYKTQDLVSLIISDIDHIVMHDAQSVLIFAGDLNGLDCRFLEIPMLV